MKFFIIVIIAVFYSLTLKAQDNKIFKRKPWEEYKQKQLSADTYNRTFLIPKAKENPPRTIVPGVVKITLGRNFLGENKNGDKIYAMQPDKMPCLVPGENTVFNMPVADAGKADVNLNLLLNNERKGEIEKGGQNK